jgi:hypothetical protein
MPTVGPRSTAGHTMSRVCRADLKLLPPGPSGWFLLFSHAYQIGASELLENVRANYRALDLSIMPSIQENICGYTIYSPYLLAGCMIEHVNTTAQEWLRNKLYILGQQRQRPKLPIQESGQSSKSSAAFLRDRAVGERPASSSPRLPDQRKCRSIVRAPIVRKE